MFSNGASNVYGVLRGFLVVGPRYCWGGVYGVDMQVGLRDCLSCPVLRPLLLHLLVRLGRSPCAPESNGVGCLLRFSTDLSICSLVCGPPFWLQYCAGYLVAVVVLPLRHGRGRVDGGPHGSVGCRGL